MEYTSLVLIHVFFGIVWAGAGILLGFFLVPSAMDAGLGGGLVMAAMMKRKFATYMLVAAFLVVLTGLRLYMVRFSVPWLSSPEGIALTVGGVLGIGALLLGMFVQRPLTLRLAALASELAASGAAPSPAKAAELEAARQRLRKIARVNAWHLVGAALLMSAHRLFAQL